MSSPIERIGALLIEDSPSDARLIREYALDCRHIELEVEHVDRLASAIEAVARRTFDVILLDLELPDCTGVGTLARARAAAPRIPIIVMTGTNSESIAVDAVRMGAQDYLVKGSFDTTLLERSIRYAVGRWQATLALRDSEERYALAMEGVNDGIWDWDLGPNEIYYSPRWKGMLGYEPDELGSDPLEWFDRIHSEEIDQVKELVEDHIQGKTPCLSVEHRIRHRDGSYRWVLSRGLAIRDEDNKAYRLAGSQSDISARKDAEHRLLHAALHDDLTGLPNRALILDRVERAMIRRQRQPDRMFGVISLKIDRFQMINDSFGYAAGDQVIQEVKARLVKTVGRQDTVARIGGAHYAVLLEDIGGLQETIALANQLQAELSRPIHAERCDVFTPVSIGITTSAGEHSRAEDHLRSAEIAMHRARTLGGARCEVFGSEMHEHMTTRLQLEREVRQGIERGEFCWHYQPIVCLIHGHVLGFEALMRWEHPERGTIQPGEFVRLLEETGLITPLFRQLLPRALEQVSSWQKLHPRTPPLFVNINLSRCQLADPELPSFIDDIRAMHPYHPYSVGLELTEEGVMGEASTALTLLRELKARELRLVLDDFGTGYSSLNHLQRYPIDELKIDRSFVAGLPSDLESTAITRAIVNLAHALGMTVTAEGIETQEQLAEVQELHCEHGQGYLFSRPVAPGQIEAMSYVELCSIDNGQEGRHRGDVLVVDDDAANRRLMSLQLEEAGFEVGTAASGQECLDAVLARRPEVILLDIQMPAMDGIGTCKRLKHNPETADIPVLFITGHRDDDPTVVEALSAGGNDFLSKDAPMPILLARVESQITIARANHRLRNMAMTDDLTGLYSRRFLYDALRQAIKSTARKRRGDEGLACLMIDIDHFKSVNDSHGHLVGDKLLRLVAQTIKEATRETDRVARFGGEEFVVVLPDTPLEGALTVANRVWKDVPHRCDGTTVSVGVAHILPTQVERRQRGASADSDPVELALNEILQRADEAMYMAKSNGRNVIAVHPSAKEA